jgi:hypothetical protein
MSRAGATGDDIGTATGLKNRSYAQGNRAFVGKNFFPHFYQLFVNK